MDLFVRSTPAVAEAASPLPKVWTETPLMEMGFTGTRERGPKRQIEALAFWLADRRTSGFGVLHHGDCVGMDAVAHRICRALGLWIVGHPPTDERLRAFCAVDEERPALPYIPRNRRIVRCGAELTAAPRGPEERRSGTWSTVRYALDWGKLVTVVWPNGRVEERR